MGNRRYANLLTAIVLFLTFACAVVGTFGSQYRNDTVVGPNTLKNRVYLYMSENEIENGDTTRNYYKRSDFECKSYFDKLIAAFSIGLGAILFSLIATILAILRVCLRIRRLVVTFFAFLAFACLTTSFAISVSTYTRRQCGTDSFKDRDYTIDWGLVVLIIGAGLGLIGTIFSLIFRSGYTDDHPKDHHHHNDNISYATPSYPANQPYPAATTTTTTHQTTYPAAAPQQPAHVVV